MRKVFLLAACVAAVVATTGTAARAETSRSTAVVISTRVVPKLGTILVNGAGRTLYMFVPDKHKKVTCVSTCAVIWPPVKLAKGAKPVAKGTAKASLLGSDPDPAGGRVVTYHGWPLYTYVSDAKPGQANGQALKLNGGLWYVLTASGSIIKKKP
jgi:predicted lipoprotein with Yx(FWY)xxD motif